MDAVSLRPSSLIRSGLISVSARLAASTDRRKFPLVASTFALSLISAYSIMPRCHASMFDSAASRSPASESFLAVLSTALSKVSLTVPTTFKNVKLRPISKTNSPAKLSMSFLPIVICGFIVWVTSLAGLCRLQVSYRQRVRNTLGGWRTRPRYTTSSAQLPLCRTSRAVRKRGPHLLHFVGSRNRWPAALRRAFAPASDPPNSCRNRLRTDVRHHHIHRARPPPRPPTPRNQSPRFPPPPGRYRRPPPLPAPSNSRPCAPESPIRCRHRARVIPGCR